MQQSSHTATRRAGFRAVVILAALLFTVIPPSGVQAAESLPPISAEELDDLMQSQDGPLVISVMASWCPPCRQELPRLDALYEKLAPQGLKMVGVSLDYSAKAMSGMIADADIAFPFYWAGEEPMTTYSIRGIPLLFIVDDGEVRQRIEGLHPSEELEAVFRSYLEE